MKKLALIMGLFGLFAACAEAQAGKLVLKEDTPTIAAKPKLARSINAEEWGKLESNVVREDWASAALLAREYLDELDTETTDRQMARLRYIYLYSLAGKLIGHSLVGEKASEVSTRNQLEQAAANFTGKEFVFPVRTILANCDGVVNYICESKENPGFLRIAATNSDGSAIHSFEYIDMHSLLDVKRHNKKTVILGGFLKAVKLKAGEPFTGVLVLQFENGYVRNIFDGK